MNARNKRLLVILLTILVCGLTYSNKAYSQEKSLLSSLSEDERNTVEAVALYPESERLAILEASVHPEVLVRMQNIRKNTEEQFKDLLAPLPKEDQKKIFELSRYPDLVEEISYGRQKKTKKEMEEILSNYPEEVHDPAQYVNRKHYNILVSSNDLYQSSQQSFSDILADYPGKTQSAYEKLVELPEVITILTDNMNTTVLLGDIYKRHPEQLQKELNDLNVVLAEEKAKELNEWKQELEKDPKAKEEYEKASKEFAKEQGYSENDYHRPVTNVYVNYVWQPYPYWFGWPWWYTYECWYPYPWWYHWGYYYGPGNTMVFIGFPSSFYMHWHFSHYTYFYHYPHFTNHVIRYSHAHPRSYTSVSRSVRSWEKKNRPNLPKNWLADDRNRIERIKELGKFKMDHEAATRVGTSKVLSEREFLQKNADRYPNMKKALKEKPEPTSPVVRGNRDMLPVQQKSAPPVRKPNTIPQNKRYNQSQKVIIKKRPSTDQHQKIDRARNFHQNSWEKATQPIKRTTSQPEIRQRPQPQPNKRSQPMNRKTMPPPRGGGRNR